jgi:hypothetical protein
MPEFIETALGVNKNDPPSFDVFLRQISNCTNLQDAYKIRDNIISETNRKSNSIG